ncbi:MAG: protein kinase [Tepidiformaceae bacterium]
MASERIQRRIDTFLDEADEAASRRDWAVVVENVEAVLAIDPANEDALAFVQMAEAGLRASGKSAKGPSPSQEPSEPSASQPPLPRSFAGGRYAVRRFLGEGGRKRVFLAHDSRLDREVAFCVIRAEGLDMTGRQRVLREAQSVARLGQHPNLVTVHDIGEDAGNPYIVQEYMGGGDVAGLIAQAEDHRLPVERTLQVAKEVCRGLSFIHTGGMVHRDLKPANVFLSTDGAARIGDFGLAVALDRSRITQYGLMLGTVSYMPPEQALGGESTPKADLYSLGCMLYEMVTGRPPFVGDDPTAVISQHLNMPPVAPSWVTEHCPPALEDVILQLLAKVPADRPKDAAEVLAALELVDPTQKSASHSESNVLDRLARGVFVGREKELERLRKAFDNAFAGHGNLVMLVGEPGIGKTRTSKEIETYARMRGAQVLVGKTHESAGMPPYWPWVEVGRSWSEQNNRDFTLLQPTLGTAAPELSRIFPELRVQPNFVAPEPITDPESAQFRLFDAYTTFVRAMAEHTLLLIVLDDLHWADRPTLMLLQHMARTLARMRVLVIGTYRDTDVVRASALSETLANLNREPGFERVVLRGLDRQEVEAYIRATANVEVSPSLVKRIHEETEGIPFFLSEVVNLMAEEGCLTADSSMGVALPEGVKEALGRRLDRLSPEANELLQVASVAGREFQHDTLLALGDHTEDKLFALLEEGLAARVIEEAGQAGRYRFTHALMQETLLDELSTTRKVRLHGRIGDALEARWGNRAEERATRLAEHFVEAATLSDRYAQRAFLYSKLAAEQAEEQAAWAEAARRYESCLTLLTETEASLEGDDAGLYLAAGRCHLNANNGRDAWRRLMRAMDLYKARGDGVGMANAAVEADGVFGVTNERIAGLLKDAIEVLGDADPRLEARLHGRLCAHIAGPEAESYRLRAETLAAKYDLDDVRAGLIYLDGRHALHSGDYIKAADGLADAARRYEAANLPGDAAAALQFQTVTEILLGDTTAAYEVARRLNEYARRHHRPFFEENTAANLAGLFFGLCRFEEFDALIEEYAAAATFIFPLLRAERAMLADDTERARRELPRPEAAGGDPSSEARIHAATATVLLANGEREAARAAFERMRERQQHTIWIAVDGFIFGGPALTSLDTAIVELADDAYLRACFRSYQNQPQVAPITPQGNSQQVIYGNIALALDELAVAETAFTGNLAWAHREGADIIAGRCHLGLAEVARRHGQTGDAPRHLDAAAALFQKHGARLFLEQDGVVHRPGYQRRPGRAAPTSPLTPLPTGACDRQEGRTPGRRLTGHHAHVH